MVNCRAPGARDFPRDVPGPGRLAGVAVDRAAAVPGGPGVPARGDAPGRPLCDPGRAAWPGPGERHRGYCRWPDPDHPRSAASRTTGPVARSSVTDRWPALFRLPARVDAADITARYDKGVLEVSVPVEAVKPEGTRITIKDADAMPEQPPTGPDEEPARAGRGCAISPWTGTAARAPRIP